MSTCLYCRMTTDGQHEWDCPNYIGPVKIIPSGTYFTGTVPSAELDQNSVALTRIACALENIVAELAKRQHQEREAERERCLSIIRRVMAQFSQELYPSDGSRAADIAIVVRGLCERMIRQIENP